MKNSKEANIKIFTVHHKASKVIKNKYIVPIQVGADIAEKQLNMIKDNTGDNMSAKNELYCELTAQYWAWKNVKDADYYGLMHYRRHFMFTEEAMLNKNGEIRKYEEINEKYIEECGLDEESIKRIVGNADIILPSVEPVIPEGKNIYEHFCLYPDQHKEDYELMLEAIGEKYPEYLEAAMEYSKGTQGYFCNMFIMKKDIFFKYSEWLFTILEYMENKKDYSMYSVSEYRVLAYLAERLLGIFITYVKKNEQLVIRELQHTFVNNVEAYEAIEPAFEEKNHLVFMSSDDYYVPYLGVLLHSIIENTTKENNYDLVVLTRNITDKSKQLLLELKKGRANVSIRFVDVKNHIKGKTFNTDDYALETYYRLFAPEIFSNYSKGVYLDSDMVVDTDIAELFETDIEDYLLAAIRDYDEMGHVRKKNDDWSEYLTDYVGITDLYSPFQGGVLYMNLEKFRKECPSSKMVALATAKKYRIADQDVLNLCCEGKTKYVDPAWDIMVDNQNKNKDIFSFSPKEYYKEYKQAVKEPKIIHFCGWPKPWVEVYSDMAEYFWKYARKTPFYEIITERMIDGKFCAIQRELDAIKWSGIQSTVAVENSIVQQVDNQGIKIQGVEQPIYVDGVMVKAINWFNRKYPIGSKKRNRWRKIFRKIVK